MKRDRWHLFGLLAFACVAIALSPGVSAAETCDRWAGKAVSVQGVVEAKRAGQPQWRPVRLDDTFCPGDTIRTEKKSRAEIALQDHPVLRMDQNTTVTLGGTKDSGASLIDLIRGAAMFFSRVSRNLEVRTATVNAGVEGTEFYIRAEEDRTDLSVFEGRVLASNAAGSLAVATGQSAVAEAGKAPVHRIVVRPRDAVLWAMYYPPIVDSRPADRKEEVGDPRFHTHRASQLLAVGRVDEATADIDRAQMLDPGNSDAFALRSIIAVAQNEKEKASGLARKAVEADPKSSTARIALSYSLQASFDLPGAADSLKEAVTLAPENALAWARLAELRQSLGDLDGSLSAARKAVALNPDLSRTQTVLGFAHLTRVETKEARAAFEKAIRLDPAEPLPRLGLGLAMIREGRLGEGRRELEVALGLDPDSSILRSYLGKAYFEEKRDKLSMGQYEMAKNLDPLDPTPYFYDAIRKQTVNRPVDALSDLQKAIELNHNRAVYRSRLLLDQDLAARSASLGRIYADLGFQQLALAEGWKSLQTDPANYSAHRFLSDSYSVLPRHEIARVSELLQSQLLQPLNLTPLQPRLAESNLFLLEGAGPASLSFNEFNPLFLRDRFALQVSGIAGENGTAGEEAVVSGLYKKVSFSIGQYHNETNGFRENNDIQDDIYNAFLQGSLSPKTGIQAEVRYRNRENGDIQLRFQPDDFSTNRRETAENRLFRFGFHHAFSPGSDLLGSFMKQKTDRTLTISPVPELAIDKKGEDDAYGAELQHLFASSRIRTTMGGGFFKIDSEDVDTTTLTLVIDPSLPPEVIQFPPVTVSRDAKHANVYFYSYFRIFDDATITIGGSGDFYDSDALKKNQFNPKFGILWNPVQNTTLRAAAFRVMKRTLITNQTLEPTQVAGFNQFYDDVNATESWRYGLGVDHKFSKKVYAGAEVSLRDLNVPFTDTADLQTKFTDWKERMGRAYLYWTPHEWAAVNAEFLYERFKESSEFNLGAENVKTHRIPLGINVFHPCGASAALKATYVKQDGSFSTIADATNFSPGDDRFWLVDASIGYRLPKRVGIISVGAKNLFDKSFRFFDTDFVSPAIQPSRMFFARFTLSI